MFDRLDPEVRIALMQAADEVRELGHHRLGPEHLLLGLLTNVRGSAFELLTAHGVGYRTARDVVITEHKTRATEDESGDDSEDDSSSSLDDDRDALRAIGIDLDKVRDAVRSAFGDDITDDWGERRGRRGPGRGHGPRGRGGRGMPSSEDVPWGHRGGPRDVGPDDWPDFGPRGGGRGRRGPQSRRFGGGAARLSPTMRPVWEQVRISLREGSPFTGVTLLQALIQAHDPAVEAILATADDVAALRADVDKRTARPEAG